MFITAPKVGRFVHSLGAFGGVRVVTHWLIEKTCVRSIVSIFVRFDFLRFFFISVWWLAAAKQVLVAAVGVVEVAVGVVASAGIAVAVVVANYCLAETQSVATLHTKTLNIKRRLNIAPLFFLITSLRSDCTLLLNQCCLLLRLLQQMMLLIALMFESSLLHNYRRKK